MIRNVVFNTWPGAFFNPGGGEVQLLHSRHHLEKIGYEIHNFDIWSPQVNVDLLHQFSINGGVEDVMEGYRALGKPVALSTILWAVPEDVGFRQYIKRIFNKADILLTNSDMESELLSSVLGVSIMKFFKTRNGISEEYLDKTTDSDFRSAYDIDGDYVLSVANIDSRKNTAMLVKACEQLQLKLVLVGHIREQGYYNGFAGQYPGCRYVGPIKDVNMLKSAYQQCRLFALPSLCETPGIAALEAASQGANIVVTSEGSTVEYFGDRVTYVDPFDYTDVITGIEHAAASRVDDSLASHITSHYTWDKAALDIQAAYESI